MTDMTLTTVDNDLFDFLPEIAALRRETDIRPLRDALACLRDSVPEALELVVELKNPSSRDSRAPRTAGNWAYAVSDAGLRHEPADVWATPTGGGKSAWNRTPTSLTTWTQLHEAIGDDPRRHELASWAASLPEPKWQILTRPFELWPHPETWHPSYIAADHARPEWDGRITAWRTCQALLTDTLEALS